MRYSPTRLTTYEDCPRLYEAVYVSKTHKKPQSDGGKLGQAAHETLADLFRPRLLTARPVVPTREEIESALTEAAAAVGLVGQGPFGEVLDMLVAYFARFETLNVCVGVEERIQFRIGDHDILCALDRIDQVGPDTEVIDYKTRQQPYSKAEVHASLQLGLYNMAARVRWPQSDRYFITIVPLRFGGKVTIQHSDGHLAKLDLYVQSLIRRIESVNDFPPRLHDGCLYCGIRGDCPAYQEALQSTPRTVVEDMNDLAAVTAERKKIALLYKLIGARKKELEAAIKPHLQNVSDLVLDDVRYRLQRREQVDYPLEAVMELFEEHTGMAPQHSAALVGKTDKKALEAYLAEAAEIAGPEITMLEAALENVANRSSSRAFDARPLPKKRVTEDE